MSSHHPAHAQLKGLPFFRDFDAAEIDGVLEISEPRLFSEGHAMCRQGEAGTSMFLIVEGEARAVLKHQDDAGVEVAKFGVGDVFGEIAMLDGQPRTADVIAVTDCTVMIFTIALLRRMGRSEPRAAFKLTMGVLESVGSRLRLSNQRYLASLDIVSAISAGGTVMEEEQVA